MNILKLLFYCLASTKKTRRKSSTADKKQSRGESTAEKKQKYFIAESEKILAHSKAAAKTVSNSRTALRSLKKFLGTDDIELQDLTRKKLCSYERWLLEEEKVKPNTAALYMRSLRALYNKIGVARRADIFSAVRTTPDTSQSKKDLTVGELKKVFAFKSDNKRLQLALDIFMFSFYCMGMPFIDIYHLQWSQIRDNVLTYKRHKTDVQVIVSLTPEAIAILKKYAGKDSTFVFPFPKDDKRMCYATALRLYNKSLKAIEDSLKLKTHLSSYVARHTWATIAFTETHDIDLVAEALGHTSTKVTRTYITQTLNLKLTKTNSKIIKKVIHSSVKKQD